MILSFVSEPVASPVEPETSDWVTALVGIFAGISEGGKIIIGMIFLLSLGLFFFGRVAARKLAALLDASLAAAAEAKKAKEEAAEAKKQAADATLSVTNSHDTHVRDDIDNNQRLVMAKLEALVNGIAEVKADVGGIRSEIREDRRRVNQLADRVNTHIDQAKGV